MQFPKSWSAGILFFSGLLASLTVFSASASTGLEKAYEYNQTYVAWLMPLVQKPARRNTIQHAVLKRMVQRISRTTYAKLHGAPSRLRSVSKVPGASMRRGGGGSTQQTSQNQSRSTSFSAPSITFSNITKIYGDANFTLSPTSNSAGAFNFVSSNTNVATISGNTVVIVGAGTTTITATQAASGNFSGGTATATLTVNGMTPSITFNNVIKSRADADFTLSIASDSPGAFTFETSNTNVATISGNTAVIVGMSGGIGHHGTSTITATQAASGNYAAATATMTLTVFISYCETDPCLHEGTCTPVFQDINSSENFECSCVGMYSGIYCEEYDSFCNEDHGSLQGCMNLGTCVPDNTGGHCECSVHFTGDYCELPIFEEARMQKLMCVNSIDRL